MTNIASSSRSELMFLGKECHHPACHLNDFLPFSCPACRLSFCQPHFLPSQHSCTSPLPAGMVDRIAPQCPLCNEIVPTTATRDANEAVERHLLSETCTGLPGGEERRKLELRRKKERGQVCWRKGCSKTLIVQMKCEACGHSFCPPHRHASSHTCSPDTSRSATPQPTAGPSNPKANAPGSNAAKAAMSRFLPTKSTPQPVKSSLTPSSQPQASPAPVKAAALSGPADPRGAAAAAAMRRAGEDVKAAVPFVKTKTEKRANAEMSSQMQALKARHEKGLLSKTEELKYAEMMGKKESSRRKGEKGKDGCLIA